MVLALKLEDLSSNPRKRPKRVACVHRIVRKKQDSKSSLASLATNSKFLVQ